jgi:hypothetical protein
MQFVRESKSVGMSGLKEQLVNDDIKSGGGKATARRRLIRGVFAAPAALTLCSGSAFAQASNQQCIARQVNGESPQFPRVGPADTWVRVRVWVHQNGSGPQTRLVSADRILHVQGTAGEPFNKKRRGQQWINIARPLDEFSPKGSLPKKTEEFVALLFDDKGNIAGISDGTAQRGLSAIAQSCWTSFSGVGFRA